MGFEATNTTSAVQQMITDLQRSVQSICSKLLPDGTQADAAVRTLDHIYMR